ncbi:hypothetical protein HOLleu_14191 [Holothuria leucospilota]|uniref:Integrase catalytic domain-containing protein n=1 Tax=Holothuria leucospilota TaxID=206669 RepID=A0A9Q1C8A7_HOLLE|nr:hypothetical protein HOLleu_14191 [Holothuria leucospilota]
MVQEILRNFHNSEISGHLGITKTIEKIRKRFYWYGLRKDVEDHCRACAQCAQHKGPNKSAKAPLSTSKVGYPFERVAIDIMGPLPETDRKNKYIIVIMDYFTKWAEAFPMCNQNAATVAQIVVDNFICRFGAPEIIHTNQGRNFESELFLEMCNLFDIQKTRTTPYHPQSDGLVERANRTIKSMLSIFTSDTQDDWDVILPKVMCAYRSSVQETTHCTPYYLMFGREIQLPFDVMYGSCKDSPKTASEHVSDLRQNLNSTFERVRENMKVKQRREKDFYDVKAHGKPYEVGDYFWLHVTARKKGVTSKLTAPWQGPYKILKKISDLVYRIQHVNNKRKRSVVHFNRLKRCQASDAPVLENESSTNENLHSPQKESVESNSGSNNVKEDATALLWKDTEYSSDPEEIPTNTDHFEGEQRTLRNIKRRLVG